MCQANTVDMTPRSPSYEVCLAKYSKRGLEVFVPSHKIDSTASHLLVLEKLHENNARNKFLVSRELPGTMDVYLRLHIPYGPARKASIIEKSMYQAPPSTQGEIAISGDENGDEVGVIEIGCSLVHCMKD
ncbi:hypothetical protein K443DRAFT_643272 [Laccaria amethystina LaAM-08-1]|uniref:Uncharacterized protein n=1 Tax=Laccaria amethystina LaAM-08-1 TaxID=1095629 RepID=A0A0C9X8G4_9AGAR|nr:hypothetical protein K443DRAFT_643272 [Laccaria amethystina LaAM-08-1]